MLFFLALLCAITFGGAQASGYVSGVVLAALAYYVLYAIAICKLFKKTGRPGWMGFIPFLNRYEVYKMSWTTKAFWIALLLSVASTVLSKQDQSSIIMSIVVLAVAIGSFIIEIKFNLNFAKSFGKGVGFAIGLILFQAIFTMILGLGDAQYQGPQA